MKKFSLMKMEMWAEKILPKLMMLFLVYLVTAASFHGFMDKWHLRDGEERFGIEIMMDGTATRPFAYRQLIPQAAEAVTQQVPENVREKLATKFLNGDKELAGMQMQWKRDMTKDDIIEREIIKGLSFLFFFASVCVLMLLLSELLENRVVGTVTAFLFALLFPLLETNGGYYYDFGELFFFFLAVRFALRGQWIGLLLITPFATWNKEAFFFFLLTLFPFHWKRFGWKLAILLTAGTVFVSGLAYLPVHFQYAGNPGETAYQNFWSHASQIFWIRSYFAREITYGLHFGARMFFFHIVFVLWIAFRAWGHLPKLLQYHIGCALVVSVPLYWLFCAVGELRNLSILYPSFVVLLGFYLRDIMQRCFQPTKIQ